MENNINTKIKQVLSTVLVSNQRSNPYPNGLSLKEFERFYDTYVYEFEKTLTNNGKEYTLKLFKELYNQSVRIVTKEPWSAIPYHKSSADGVSTLLIPMLKHLRSDRYRDIRIILSVTRIYESIRIKPVLDTDPISTPYKGTADLDEFATRFLKFLQDSRVTRKLYQSLPKLVGSQELIGRIRSGPNGQAIVTSHYDAVAVCQDSGLRQAIARFNMLLNQAHITGAMEWCNQESSKLIQTAITGRISLASERGGKTRLFAIGDYWSQNSLQSLHDWLMKILKKLPSDGTYDQHASFERIRRKKVRFMVSYDISKFTCRVPLLLQVVLLSYYISPDLAQCWAKIVGGRAFRVSGTNDFVTWCVGQPLGLLSSWATCTLLHHHLVWYASYLHFKDFRSFNAYEITGDDIVLWHRGVAKAYARLLNELGIEINMSKSKLYNGKKEKLPIFEYVKRTCVANNEISGIPYDLLRVSVSSIYDYVDLVLHLVETKLLVTCRDLALPEYLSTRGKYLLEILLWEKGLGRPAWIIQLGNALEAPLLNALRKQVARVRIAGFQELIRKLDELCYSSNLEQKLTQAGVAYSDMLIGYGGAFYHPIVHALNSVGMKMYETLPYLEAIESAEADGAELTLPELTEIEYLPLPYMSAHFERPGKRNPERLRKHSQLVLTATKQLKAHPYGFVLLNEPEPKDDAPG